MADAFVLHGWHLSPKCLEAIRQRRCPSVFFECNFSAGDPQDHHIGSVRLNYSKVGHALTSELIGLGRNKIAFLDPGPSLDKSSVYLGYLSALRESSVVHDTRLAFSIGQGEPVGYENFKRGQQACRQLLALGPNAFDGVIAAGDIHASGFMSELLRNRVRIPEDVAVFSINDSLHCECAEPQLSAAWFDTGKIAEAILTQLCLAEQQADRSHAEILLDPELHRRESTHPSTS
jgi:DNA-binding LacI/PurR family transcriptional regulator